MILETKAVSDLRAALNGRVIAPDDAGYDQARTVFVGGIDRRPAAIVRVADATDVSHVVSLARETGLELAVRSGGHSSAGHSVSEGGIVLDLADTPEGATALALVVISRARLQYTRANTPFGR